MKFKKLVVGAVVTSMIFTNSMMGFAAVPAPEKDLFDDLLVKFGTILNDKENSALDLYYLATELKDNDLVTKLDAALDDMSSSKESLDTNYGINATSLNAVIDGIIDLLPTDLSALQSDNNLFGRLYDDTDIQYSEYAADLKQLAVDMYDLLPTGVQTELLKFTKDGDVEKEAVFIAILDVAMGDTFGSTEWNTTKSQYTSISTGFEDQTRVDIVAVLKEFKNIDVTDSNIDSISYVFYDMGNAMLSSIVDSYMDISNTTQEDGKDELEMFAAMMVKANFFSKTNVSDTPVTPDEPDSGGSSGGSSSGGSSKPATEDKDSLDKDSQDDLSAVEDALPQAGEDATDAEKTAAKDNVDALLTGVSEDLGSAKDADTQVKAVSSAVGSTIAVLDGEAAAQVANEFAGLVEKALANENVSVAEQKAMVKDAVENTFSALVKNEDASKSDLVDVKASVVALIETVIKNASTVEVKAASDNTFAIEASDISASIKLAAATQAEMVKSLQENGLSDVAKDVEQLVNISLPDADADATVSLTLDAAAVKTLGDSGAGVTVEAKGLNFKLPAALMQAAKSLTVEAKPVSADAGLTQKTDAGTVTNHQTLDVTVADGEETVKGMVELSFDISELDVNLDELMVGVFENGAWTKLDYKIVDGMAIFTAPHFSIYSLMSFEASFTDIEESWAKKYITSLTAKGVISGKSAEMFDPTATLTRAEFTTMLVKHLGLTDEVSVNFSDVTADEWYYTYIGQAGLNSLTVGMVDGKFMPNEPITREDMAVMLYRAYKLKHGFNLNNASAPFSDHSDIQTSAVDAVYATKTNGIISGYPDNTFKPEAFANRAEAATMLYLFMNK